MNCHRCGDPNIIYYRQVRRDGISVVTARCSNGHIPELGRPFYPISQFDVMSLPILGEQDDAPMLPGFSAMTQPKQTGMFIKASSTFERLMGDK